MTDQTQPQGAVLQPLWTNDRIHNTVLDLARDHKLSIAMIANISGLMRTVRDDERAANAATIAELRAELAQLRAQVEAAGEWQDIDDQWFDFHWDINGDGFDDPVGQRAYGYHVYRHPTLGQVFDLWVHGSLRTTTMIEKSLRLQRKRVEVGDGK